MEAVQIEIEDMNEYQLDKLKDFLSGMSLKFKIDNHNYSKEFKLKMDKGISEIEEGKGISMSMEELRSYGS